MISPARATWPKAVRSRLMSMIERPVTVIAEVTVNRASQRPTSSVEQSGLARMKVPSRITRPPVTTVNWGTVSLWRQRWTACSGLAFGAPAMGHATGKR